MSTNKIITQTSLNDLLKKLKAGGKRIIAPVPKGDRVVFAEISSPDELARDYIQTTMSPKMSLLPRYEEILHYKIVVRDVHIREESDQAAPTIVFGARPCDGRSFGVLNAVFTWDCDDMFFISKRDATTIISVSCAKNDAFCFCTSLGGGPGDTTGSDILLTKIDDTRFLAEILTEKGQAIVAGAPELFADATAADAGEKEKHLAKVEVQFDKNKLLEKVANSFDHEIYNTQSLRCVGCGACSYVCPACSCFDIQDEIDCANGVRLRCWDSCGFGHFTLHTSWHNPRNLQSKRWRQRVMHKFYYQPDTLSVIGCVGCGRCSRSCPVGMNLLDHLKEIVEKIS